MSARVDFSRNANVYDRRHGVVLPGDTARALASAAAFQPRARVLDVGAGTGRVAIPFSEIGCDVWALDPAHGMLEVLRGKASGLTLRLVAGEGARLPFEASCFDAVVIARLLYLLPDWRDALRDAVRVLKPEGRLLHEWANGRPDEEWVQIREKARALFEDAGVEQPFHPGVRSEVEVEAFLAELGLARSADVRIGPGPGSTLADFLGRIVSGECSYIWNVPDAIQRQCLPELRAWAEGRFDLGRSAPMPRELSWKVYRSA